MPRLQPDGTLERPGVRIRSVGVSGQADAVLLDVPGAARDQVTDVREQLGEAGVPDAGARALAGALADQELRPVLAVPLDELAVPPGPAGDPRALDDGPAVELTVDAPGADEAQVLLEIDAAGVVSWHFAENETAAAGVRSGLEQVFRVPVRQLDPGGDPAELATRGIFGIGTKKLLQVLRYPVERAAAGFGRVLVARWEDRHRPYGLRRLDGGAPDLAALAGRPVLLLVHGTFSTGASAFGGLLADAAFLAELRTRYGDGVLLFDHPSVHVDPTANVTWLLDQLPPGADLTLDVVSHSRGGLVARALGAAAPLRTVVHVGTPNSGTALADTGRWGTLLDAVSNVFALFPDDTVSVPLTAVVETVKHVGTGIAEGLDGLAAMSPGSPWLSRLAAPATPARSYAVASDFDPEAAPLPVRALNVLVDPFFGEGNDLVVPTDGVAAGLAVAERLVVPRTPAVAHTTYFRQQEVRAALARWLPAG